MGDAALKDDFDTPASIAALTDLVKATNLYLEGFQVQQQQPHSQTTNDTPTTPPRKPVTLVVRNAANFVTHIFRIFGLIPDSAGVELGFPVSTNNTSSSSTGGDEGVLTPVLDALINFRSSVRDKAR